MAPDGNGGKKPRIAVIIPAFNEEGRIGKVLASIPHGIVDDVLVIDDGSTDATRQEAIPFSPIILEHEHVKGIGHAIRQGLHYALDHGYDVVVIMAGNGKDDGAEIPRLLEPILERGFDYAQGSRYLRGGRYNSMPLHRRILTRVYPLLFRIGTGFHATDATNGFRAYRTSILTDSRINIDQQWLDESLEYYLGAHVCWLGYKVTEVPVSKLYPVGVPYRQYTKIKPFIGWLRRLKPLIYLVFTHRILGWNR